MTNVLHSGATQALQLEGSPEEKAFGFHTGEWDVQGCGVRNEQSATVNWCQTGICDVVGSCDATLWFPRASR